MKTAVLRVGTAPPPPPPPLLTETRAADDANLGAVLGLAEDVVRAHGDLLIADPAVSRSQ